MKLRRTLGLAAAVTFLGNVSLYGQFHLGKDKEKDKSEILREKQEKRDEKNLRTYDKIKLIHTRSTIPTLISAIKWTTLTGRCYESTRAKPTNATSRGDRPSLQFTKTAFADTQVCMTTC